MDWTIISQGIISTVAGTLIAGFLTFIAKNLFYKKDKELTPTEKKTSFFADVFLILLFITTFLIVLTFFSFIYSWQIPNGAYLLVASILMCMATAWAYNNQCPKCRAVFHGKKLIDKQTLNEEKRPYRYRHEIRYLYSDGSIKDRKFVGAEKTKMETWRIEKEFYECDTCHYKWDKVFERNLDEANRPKPEIHKTRFKNPEY